MRVKEPARSTSRTTVLLPSVARVEVRTVEWNLLCVTDYLRLHHSVSIILIVSSEFQTPPSHMTREVSLDTMRLLRMNLFLSSSLQQAREAAAVISSQSVTGVAQGMTNHLSPVASSHQWSSMASSPLATNNSTDRYNFAAKPLPRVLTEPSLCHIQSRWIESQSFMRASRDGMNGDPKTVVQYLHLQHLQQQQQQQKQVRRGGARHCERGSHGVSGFTCPPTLSISQALVVSNPTFAQLPAVLSCSTDGVVLTEFQVFLRLHIAAFAARRVGSGSWTTQADSLVSSWYSMPPLRAPWTQSARQGCRLLSLLDHGTVSSGTKHEFDSFAVWNMSRNARVD
jgi:hypothetical protein